MSRLLGIDAGGSRTKAVLWDSVTGASAEAEGGPCNWSVLDPELCLEAIDAAVAGLRSECDAADRGRLGAVCLCSAGYYAPHHRPMVAQALQDRWPEAQLRLETDLVAAWAGALAARPGVVVIAGTGSVAYGRLANGREARAGGWGPQVSDEGSGYWLACRGLAAVARAVDGRGPPTSLTRLLQPASIDQPAEPAEWLRELLRRRPGRAEIASLAPQVIAAAETGDPLAGDLLREAAVELARLACAVEAALGAASLPWTWSGGLIAASASLRERVQVSLTEQGSGLRMAPPRLGGEWGALLLAGEQLGADGLRERIVESRAP
jgi:N-acetylglucosamine kinase-like BadF-type ATPase